jgi:hypothetical protein
MSNYTTYVGGAVIADGAGSHSPGFPSQTVLVATFDASKRNLDAADTADIATIYKGTYIRNMFIEVLTADSGESVDVGDASDTDAFIDGQSLAAAGTFAVGLGTAAGGKLYTADTTLRIAAPAGVTLDTAKFKIYAEVIIFGIAA